MKECRTIVDDQLTNAPSLDWRAIGSACLVFLIGCGVVVVVWGLLGLTLFAIAGERGLNWLGDTPLGYALGDLLLLLPVLAGAWKLSRAGVEKAMKHCFVFGCVALVLIGLQGVVSGALCLDWHTTPYYLAVVPTALLGGVLGRRSQQL